VTLSQAVFGGLRTSTLSYLLTGFAHPWTDVPYSATRGDDVLGNPRRYLRAKSSNQASDSGDFEPVSLSHRKKTR
jgi:hypothetical protein